MSTTTRLPAISERAWQRQLIALLHLHSWRTYATWTSVHSVAGYPDITAIHPSFGCVWIEAKSDTGQLTPAQLSWLHDLEMAGQRSYILRPRDFPLAERIARGEA